MKTTFEKMGGTYRQAGDYLLPDIEAPESPQIGMWGQRRLQYLRTNERVLYTTMLIGDTLKVHLEEVDKSESHLPHHLRRASRAFLYGRKRASRG